jgi:hypothetical protein
LGLYPQQIRESSQLQLEKVEKSRELCVGGCAAYTDLLHGPVLSEFQQIDSIERIDTPGIPPNDI